ncbi:MAG TPA: DUF2157 domain-containing protein [Patescibacteria group bacterium]|nr:DUF2157 domain-containing protein [Patescibacteria group bacterium]
MDQKVVEYIRSGLAQNKTKEAVYQELLTQGVRLEVIQESFHELDADAHKEDTQKNTIRIILIIAAILIGAGIFSFIASNWQGMSTAAKIVTIFFFMGLSYGLGWYCKEKKQLQRTADAFMLLGVLIYGAGIFLVGQIFHITSNWPDAFILWMLGVIAMAFAVESFVFFSLAVVLGLIAVFDYPILLFFESRSMYLGTSTALLVVATVVTFVVGLVIRKRMPSELRDLY